MSVPYFRYMGKVELEREKRMVTATKAIYEEKEVERVFEEVSER